CPLKSNSYRRTPPTPNDSCFSDTLYLLLDMLHVEDDLSFQSSFPFSESHWNAISQRGILAVAPKMKVIVSVVSSTLPSMRNTVPPGPIRRPLASSVRAAALAKTSLSAFEPSLACTCTGWLRSSIHSRVGSARKPCLP